MDITKLKKETEEIYLRIGNQIAQVQSQLNDLAVERTRIEGELRLLEKLGKETKEVKKEKCKNVDLFETTNIK